jgi:uncharacterized protein (TIGR00369 family)
MESIHPQEPVDPQIKKRVSESFDRQRLMKLYGAKLTGIGRGQIEMTVPSSETLLRTSGNFHGGVIAAMADSSGGYAATTLHAEDVSFLTIEFKVNFLNQARGSKLIARARVIKAGRTITVAQSDLYTDYNGAEIQVATALLTFIKEKK